MSLMIHFIATAKIEGFEAVILMIGKVLDVLISIHMVYLMIDHNNGQYIVFIKRLQKIKLFCCCPSFVDITMGMEIEDTQPENIADSRKKKALNEKPNQATYLNLWQ